MLSAEEMAQLRALYRERVASSGQPVPAPDRSQKPRLSITEIARRNAACRKARAANLPCPDGGGVGGP